MSARQEAIYGEPRTWVCRCYTAHGVQHICALDRDSSDFRPAQAWVEAEKCRICLVEEAERLDQELAFVYAKLKSAMNPVDGVTGEPIPPKFLTARGWED
jgi:hypothetical protein